MKSGFDNIKELIGILINDEADTAGYDIYMNSNDKDLAKTAMLLQSLEYEQEEKRFSLFKPKEIKKTVKKNYKSIDPPTTSKIVPKDTQIKGLEPDK